MAAQTNSAKALTLAEGKALLRARDFVAAGVPRATLSRLVAEGALQRTARGIYMAPGTDISAQFSLAETALAIPHGVIALASALIFHGLTTQLPHKVWIMLPSKAWAPINPPTPLRIFRTRPDLLMLGVEHHTIDGVRVQITNPARTIVDCFKHRNSIGLDVAIEALRDGLRRRKTTHAELGSYARALRMGRVHAAVSGSADLNRAARLGRMSFYTIHCRTAHAHIAPKRPQASEVIQLSVPSITRRIWFRDLRSLPSNHQDSPPTTAPGAPLIPVMAAGVGTEDRAHVLVRQGPLDGVGRELRPLVQQRRGERPEAVSAHLLFAKAQRPERHANRVLADRPVPAPLAGEAARVGPESGPALQILEDCQSLARERDAMLPAHLHPLGRNRPNRRREVDLIPARQPTLTGRGKQ